MSIDWRQSYFDLCKEIEILDIRAMDLERELRAILKQVWTGMAPSDPLPVHVPLDKSLHRYDEVRQAFCDLQEVLRSKRQAKEQIEKRMSEFEGLEYKVAFMRDIQRKPLNEIAEELGYSLSWIMKMSMKVKRLKEGRNKEVSA
jgi:hypothetical protein